MHFEHLAFLGLLAAAALATLWDPFFRALLAWPPTALLLQATASFAALNVVLPVLGASNRVSLWVSAGATAVLLPLVAAAIAPADRARVAGRAAVVGAALPLVLALGGTRLIPAAPLRLVRVEMGSALAGGSVVDATSELSRPTQLACATVIWAPRGLSDALFHVWRREGTVTDRIALEIHGGGADGFHTWSIKRHFDPAPGLWTCSVETASGQLLGERSLRVVRAPDGG